MLSAFPLKPMLLKSARQLPTCGRYSYEIKWDGFRAIVFLDRGKLRVQSRNLRDMSDEFPELQAMAEAYRTRRLILDGEILALGADGKPDFSLLHGRLGRNAGAPVTFMAFDLLQVGGKSAAHETLETRRRRLEDLEFKGAHWNTSKLFSDGEKLRQLTRKMGLEGIVAKELHSRYEFGRRSGAWLKLKNTKTDTFWIGGIIPPDRRPGRGWALLVGQRRGNALTYAGSVELGVTGDVLSAIERDAWALVVDRSCFTNLPRLRGAFFLRPRLCVRVQYLNWRDGGTLREACCRGILKNMR